MLEIFKILGTVAVDTAGAEQSLDNVTSKASKSESSLSKTFKKIGGAVAGAFTVKAVADFGKACFNAAATAEAAFAKVNTLLADGTDTEAYFDSIKKASAETGVAVEDFSEAVYQAISASVDQADAVAFTQEAIKLSKGGFTDAATAVDVLTTAINAYGMDASDATKISDMLITTQNLGKTTVDELASSIGNVIPTANAFGVEIDTLCGAYAVMTKNGIATAESTTYMNSMLNELGKSGTKASKLLEDKTGESFQELMNEGVSLSYVLETLQEAAKESGVSMMDVFGSAEAAKAATLLASQAEDLDASIKAMGDSAGATQKAYEKMSGSMQDKIQRLKNKFTLLSASIGEKLSPAVGWVIDKFSDLADFLSANFEPALDWVSEKFRAAGSYLSQVFSPVIENVKTIFGKVKEAVQPLIDKFTAFVTSSDTVTGASNLLKEALQFVSDALTKVTEWIIKGINWLTAFVTENAGVKKSLAVIWNAVKLVFESAWKYIKDIWDAVSGYFNTIWENIKAVFSGEIDPKTFFKNTFKAAYDAISEIFNAAVTYFQGIWDGIVTIFSTEDGKTLLSNVFDAAWTAIKTVWDVAVGFFAAIWESITGIFGAEGAIGKITDVFTDAWKKIESTFTGAATWFEENVSKPINDAISGMCDWVQSLIDAWNEFWGMDAEPPNGTRYEFGTHSGRVGKYATGLSYVPYDNFPAYLHEGERVLTKEENQMYNRVFSSGGITAAQNVVAGNGLQLEAAMVGILNLLSEYMPKVANMQLVTDTGALVGAIAPAMDGSLGRAAMHRGRGN